MQIQSNIIKSLFQNVYFITGLKGLANMLYFPQIKLILSLEQYSIFEGFRESTVFEKSF